MISAPVATAASTVGSPSMAPMTLTGLAGRISFPRLMGVGPQKRQSALPGGQYATAPLSTVSAASGASAASTGIEK